MRSRIVVVFAVCLASIFPAQAQSSVQCSTFRAAALGEGISSAMLQDGQGSARCLVGLIEEAGNPSSPGTFNGEERKLLIQSSGALLRFFAMGNPVDQVSLVRHADDLDFTSILTYAAQDDDPVLRRNASLVLANTIDNSTVCVPLDHLANPGITANGRVNLLGIVSTVAPWAVAENYDNISKAALYFEALSRDDADLEDTAATVANLETRLQAQDKYVDASPKADRGSALLAACRAYQPLWATGAPYGLSY